MKESATIYCLRCPETGEIRYVGKCDNLKTRFLYHIRDKRASHRASWIKSLQARGTNPHISILEICKYSEWQSRETFWIRKLKSEGFRLTNMNEGGLGGCSPSCEVIEKIRASKLGKKRNPFFTEKHKLAISERFKGKPKSEETKAKMRAALKSRKPMSKDVIEIIAAKKCRPVMCKTTGEAFLGLKHAAEKYGITRDSVFQSCAYGKPRCGLEFSYL